MGNLARTRFLQPRFACLFAYRRYQGFFSTFWAIILGKGIPYSAFRKPLFLGEINRDQSSDRGSPCNHFGFQIPLAIGEKIVIRSETKERLHHANTDESL